MEITNLHWYTEEVGPKPQNEDINTSRPRSGTQSDWTVRKAGRMVTDSSSAKKMVVVVELKLMLVNKKRNRIKRSSNGNGNNVNKMKIVHWNLGARLWKNKQDDIELLLENYKPDLCFITEANLWDDHSPEERAIVGHKLILANTMKKLKHSRIVLLVRDEVNVTVLNQFMDETAATIWVQVGGNSRNNSIRVGGGGV